MCAAFDREVGWQWKTFRIAPSRDFNTWDNTGTEPRLLSKERDGAKGVRMVPCMDVVAKRQKCEWKSEVIARDALQWMVATKYSANTNDWLHDDVFKIIENPLLSYNHERKLATFEPISLWFVSLPYYTYPQRYSSFNSSQPVKRSLLMNYTFPLLRPAKSATPWP